MVDLGLEWGGWGGGLWGLSPLPSFCWKFWQKVGKIVVYNLFCFIWGEGVCEKGNILAHNTPWNIFWILHFVLQVMLQNHTRRIYNMNLHLHLWLRIHLHLCLQIYLHTVVDSKCSWPENDSRRQNFCEKMEGYGKVCDCDDPAPITFSPPKVNITIL